VRLPEFPVPAGETAYSHLRDLCQKGLRERYRPVSPAADQQLTKELGVIERGGLAEYFLVVHEIVDFARQRGILCQGRGSAAGSVVAYVLGITPVDPLAHGLLFERFLAEGSSATPDIDVDFAADRREEVIQHVYERYGADRAAMVANVVTFQARSAVADVGKALGFSAELLEELRHALHTRDAAGIAPELAEVDAFRDRLGHLPWQQLVELCRQIDGCPRHLSIHVGGMIVTGRPLAELVPLEPATMPGRVVVQWDKDDVEDAGLIKIDLLSLRTLGLVSEAFDRIAAAGGPALAIDSVPPDDREVWQMLAAADAIGVFQVESRAQLNLLPRLRPTSMTDLTVEVSLIRPGPVQGGMAKAYLARRDGEEPVSYWHPSLEEVLAETLGVMVYQEQVLKVAMILAGFSGAQADGLRRSMSRKRSREAMERWRSDFLAGAAARGVAEAVATQVFDYLLGFSSYGFCKSHAAAFAQVTYVTAWLKCHHPLAFTCALLNAQPMGFYSTEVVVEDAKRHAIGLLPVHVNHSQATWVPEGRALRVPLARVKGLPGPVADAIVAERAANGPFTDLWDFVRRTRVGRPHAERLVGAGALDGLAPSPAPHPRESNVEGGDGAGEGASRRELLWALGEMDWTVGELDLPPASSAPAPLPPLGLADRIAADYRLLGLAQGPHLLSLARPYLAELGVVPSHLLGALPTGQRTRVAGRVEVVQRPPPAKGIAFVSIEDEMGLVNLLLYPPVYQRYRQALRGAPVIIAEGVVQHEKGALHLIVDKIAGVTLGDDEAPALPLDALPGPAKMYQ
jgi:error-prone DNA polymerase